MRRSILFAIAAAAVLGGAATAAAGLLGKSAADGNVVSADGLDLSNPYQADIMLSRIETAARRACGLTLEPQPLAKRVAAARCVNQTMTTMVTQIGSPTLSERYSRRGQTIIVAME
jgi:UrcA family protein